MLKLIVTVWIFSAIAALAKPERAPNVVLIMADDLGYHDLGCYGHAEIKTPIIDQLANDGVRLTSFYAGATVCTPSRMALLTGAYPVRLGWTKGVVGYLMEKGTGLSPDALTMAEVFKSSGYQTGISGKWHLGDEAKFLPENQGFDESFYINKSNNQTDELWRGDELLEKPFDNRQLTKKFTDDAVRFIEKNHAEPFFLYVPYSAPHFPVQAHPDWKGKSAYGVYGDVVEELDARVGEILKVLEDKGQSDNTIVIFMSDNGPEPGTKASKADPLRGRKWSSLEGGTRVPCIIRFPKTVPKGKESDAIIAAIDLLPTLSRACGIDLKKISKGTPQIDGVDVWGTLTGRKGGKHQRADLLYWHGKDGFEAIRVGEWKLFLKGKSAGQKGGGDAPALYNLSKDIGETTDVSAENPDRVKAMQALAETRLAEIRGSN